jgi:hypothetical protein
LLPYQETQEHGHNFTDPPPELIEGQEEWEVEQILDMRLYRCKRQYLIKWKGYSDAHNSWEPEENVWAPKLILAFKNKEGCKPHQKKRTRIETATLCPRIHMGSKKGMAEAPEKRRIVIRAVCPGQRRNERSKSKTPISTNNTPPSLTHHYPSSSRGRNSLQHDQGTSSSFNLC